MGSGGRGLFGASLERSRLYTIGPKMQADAYAMHPNGKYHEKHLIIMTLRVNKNSNSSLHNRVNKLLESRPENDKETLGALKELPNFFTQNTLNSRRNLWNQIEKKSLAINNDFLQAFRQVK